MKGGDSWERLLQQGREASNRTKRKHHSAIKLEIRSTKSETTPKSQMPQTPAAKQDATPAQDPPAESPVPSTEAWVSGYVEAGYRWRTDVGGNFNAYRSVVDLGEGPKLLSTDFSIRDPKKRLFDRIDTRAYNWGDDPYSTLHVHVL